MANSIKSSLSTSIILLLGFAAAVQAQITVLSDNYDSYAAGTSVLWFAGQVSNDSATIAAGSGVGGSQALQLQADFPTQWDGYLGSIEYYANDDYSGPSGNSSTNLSDYTLTFQMAVTGLTVNTLILDIRGYANGNYSGTQTDTGEVGINTSAVAPGSGFQTVSVNLGALTDQLGGTNNFNPSSGTCEISFELGAWLLAGGGPVTGEKVDIDNLVITLAPDFLALASSDNASTTGDGVVFTATVQTNGATAGNATGTVVFSSTSGPFSTNSVSGGVATSSSISNLPVGTDLITAIYSGGNYPNSTNTLNQLVMIRGTAQANLPIYTDNLVNGFQNWSFATVNLESTSPVHSGSYSISVTDTGGYQALWLAHSDFNTSPYASLSFWINGGSAGGQAVQVSGLLDNTWEVACSLGTLQAGTWQQIIIPLSSLGVANMPNCSGFTIQGDVSGALPTFYVDDIELVAAPAPALVHLGVDAGQVLRTVDARQFGLNAYSGTFDGNLANSQTLSMLQEIGCLALRWPGGSYSDTYHWASNAVGNSTFMNLATNLGAQVFTTANYGTGTPGEAANWVLSVNKTNHCGFKYWEIGNECYGLWEPDSNAVPHDPYTYATNAAAYIQQMKAAYPAVPIKVGIVVAPGEGSYSNNATHFAVNPRTGVTNYGWTPIVLSELKSLGVTPDFLIHHFYWQWTQSGWASYSSSGDSDPLLLQVAGNPCPLTWSDWASTAANLRQQITDYMGSAGSNIELCVTENNSDSGSMGRQSTSLVNALYLADSTAQLMKTEFNAYLWFDLHNGAENDGDFDPTVYGWRTSGDYGILSTSNTVAYPTFYAKKLLRYFTRPLDSVLDATSDSLLLSAYAVHRTNGALTLLIINKDMTTNLTAQIVLANFVPWINATIQSYGIPQDQAAENNAGASLQDIATTNFATAGTNFTCSFPPLSLTLFTFAPGPATLSVLGVQPGEVQLLLQGQPGTPYVIQNSPDLITWTPASTNMLLGSNLIITNLVSPAAPQQFLRAVWQP